MAVDQMVAYYGFSAMELGRVDYEAHHKITSRMQYRGVHCHDFYEFFIHFHGGQQISTDDQLFDTAPYQLFIFPPFSLHGLVCKTEAVDYERAYLYCSLDTLKCAGCGQIDLDQAFRAILNTHGSMFLMNKEDAEFCRDCLVQIAQNDVPKTPEIAFENYALILAFMNRILKAAHNNNNAEIPQPIALTPIQQVITYINEHYTEPLQLADLAQRFGISRSTLCHEFTSYTNRSVYDYILYRRIILARQLILDGRAFGDVSGQCGFSDYSNFLRVFHKQVGMSPRAYLRLHQARLHSKGD